MGICAGGAGAGGGGCERMEGWLAGHVCVWSNRGSGYERMQGWQGMFVRGAGGQQPGRAGAVCAWVEHSGEAQVKHGPAAMCAKKGSHAETPNLPRGARA